MTRRLVASFRFALVRRLVWCVAIVAGAFVLGALNACGGTGGNVEIPDDDAGGAADAAKPDAGGTGGDAGTGDGASSDGSTSEDGAVVDGSVVDGATVDGAAEDGGDGASDAAVGDGGDGGDGGGVDASDAGNLPTLSIADVAVAEGNTGTTALSFTVTLSNASTETVTVAFATADGMATTSPAALGGADFEASSGTLSFAPGEVSKSIVVTVSGDVVVEGDETLTVTLSNAVNAVIARSAATGTIQNDDDPPSISIGNAAVSEGNAGTKSILLTVSLGVASTSTVSVAWKTSDATATTGGTAAAGGLDYFGASGTVFFAPGETSKDIAITVSGDLLNEDDETFSVDLSNPTNGVISQGHATATITNDDDLPSLVIDDVSMTEGDVGTKDFQFTVSLVDAKNAPTTSGRTVSVDYATSNVSALSVFDYLATNGTLTLLPGTSSGTVTVPVVGDVVPELNETFHVDLSSVTNAKVADATGVGTIVNDDGLLPFINVTDASVTEGDSGTTLLTFTVTLSGAAASAVTVDYATADGTAVTAGNAALGGKDYDATSGKLTFAPGEVSKDVTVTVNGDTINEADETVLLLLSNASINAMIQDGLGVGTIKNDDTEPDLSIDDVSVLEGNTTTKTAVFTVTLSAVSGQTVQVSFATADDTAQALGSSSSGGNDYVSSSGVISFAPGETQKKVAITVRGDTTYESDETFIVSLSSPVHATLAKADGVGTIQNDDSVPSISITDVSLFEGTPGNGSRPTTTFAFQLKLSNPSATSITLDFATKDGTATAGSDYTAVSGTLTWTPGSTQRTVNVFVTKDVYVEANETFTLELSGPTGATLADTSGLATIKNDD